MSRDTSDGETIGVRYTMDNPPAMRTESVSPCGYRLAKRHNGELVLQGAFAWQQGLQASGVEWRDLPTVKLT